jgi:hypothetical protein
MGGDATTELRDAIIYVPGLGLNPTSGKTVQGVVSRLQRGFDTQADTRSARFTVEWHDAAVRTRAAADPLATISRIDGDEPVVVADVFCYQWAGKFMERWEAQGLLRRTFRWVLSLSAVKGFWRFFRGGAKNSTGGPTQLVVAALLIVGVIGYGVIMLGAVLQTGAQVADVVAVSAPAGAGTNEDDPGPEDTDDEQNGEGENGGGASTPDATPLQWTALISSAVAALLPSIKQRIETLGGAVSAANGYLRLAEDQPRIIGGLTQLNEAIKESGRYAKTHIVAYSFGSLITIDTLYPTTDGPEKSLAGIDTLVTIGSPFDFALAVRPDWRDGRKCEDGVPGRWINLYSGIDLLGSNFLEPGGRDTICMVDEAPEGCTVHPTTNIEWKLGIEPSFVNLLHFYGFVSHGLYWGTDEEEDRNVFSRVVAELYKDTPALA